MAAGAQLEAVAAVVLAAEVVLDAGDMAQAELAGFMVAAQLHLGLVGSVVHQHVVAEPTRGVATAGLEFAAAKAADGVLAGQFP